MKKTQETLRKDVSTKTAVLHVAFELSCNSDTKWTSVAECGPRFGCKAHIGLKGA